MDPPCNSGSWDLKDIEGGCRAIINGVAGPVTDMTYCVPPVPGMDEDYECSTVNEERRKPFPWETLVVGDPVAAVEGKTTIVGKDGCRGGKEMEGPGFDWNEGTTDNQAACVGRRQINQPPADFCYRHLTGARGYCADRYEGSLQFSRWTEVKARYSGNGRIRLGALIYTDQYGYREDQYGYNYATTGFFDPRRWGGPGGWVNAQVFNGSNYRHTVPGHAEK